MESFFDHMKSRWISKAVKPSTALEATINDYIEYYTCHYYQWGLKEDDPDLVSRSSHSGLSHIFFLKCLFSRYQFNLAGKAVSYLYYLLYE